MMKMKRPEPVKLAAWQAALNRIIDEAMEESDHEQQTKKLNDGMARFVKTYSVDTTEVMCWLHMRALIYDAKRKYKEEHNEEPIEIQAAIEDAKESNDYGDANEGRKEIQGLLI